MLRLLTTLCAVGACDAMNVACKTFERIDAHANSVVCDNEYDDVDGDFDVVGFDEESGLPILGATTRRVPFRGQTRGRAMQRGHSSMNRNVNRSAMSRQLNQHAGNLLPQGVRAPNWMNGAWGVNPPNEMLHVLPLIPQSNAGIFAAAVTSIQYLTRPQKPFRGERLLSTTTNTGASAPGVSIQSTAIFVGVDLQQVESGNIPVATWAATAFGVRLAMVDALPGIEISIPCISVGTLAGTDTVAVTLVLLGRVLA
jgi:hypothetical protein